MNFEETVFTFGQDILFYFTQKTQLTNDTMYFMWASIIPKDNIGVWNFKNITTTDKYSLNDVRISEYFFKHFTPINVSKTDGKRSMEK